MRLMSRGGLLRALHLGLVLAILFPSQPGTPPAAAAPLAASPALSASMTTALSGDANANGLAEPGDTLRSTTVITNAGGDASNVVFSATLDPNTTFVTGTL